MTVLNIGCEIQNSSRNISVFQKYNISIYEISFLFIIWEISGFYVYGEIILQLIWDFKDVRANCFCAFLLRTQIHVLMAPCHSSSARMEEDL